MGIKSLSKFLKEKCPSVFTDIHLSNYQFKKIAIDTSLYMCNYKVQYGKDWLKAFVRLVACLRENHIHCVFIYDTGFPPEKEAERKERQEQRSKMEERIYNLEQAVDKYENMNEIDPILLEFQEKRKISQKRLLSNQNIGLSLNINAINYAISRMKKQLFTISPNDFEITRKLFDILDVPYFNAPLEAETMCADLCIQGKVDAVLSEDTDVLAYGAPVFLTKINIANSTCTEIRYENVLLELNLQSDEFLDFCILCGTDYNKNIFKIGPTKSYNYIQNYKSIENFHNEMKIDISILNHIRVRELFRKYKSTNVKVNCCGQPNINDLKKFLVQRNIDIDLNYLQKAFLINDSIVFQD